MNIGVIFGSRSPEHDVSITSGYAIMQAILKNTKHKVIPLYISREGIWLYDDDLSDIKNFKGLKLDKQTFFYDFKKKEDGVYIQASKGLLGSKDVKIDCLRNTCHGENGEDGIVSGFSRLLNLPIVSTGTLAESMSIDKEIMKKIFGFHDLPLAPYLCFDKFDKTDSIIEQLNNRLNYPVFVKPNSLGSSIGVSKCENENELTTAIDVAFHYDDRVMIEQAVENLQELNCSILEKDGELLASEVEEPSTHDSFLTFEEKYTSDSGSTMKGAKGKVNIPADISGELRQTIHDYVKTIYKGFKMKGGAPRIDFLYDKVQSKLYVNEVNVTPGSLQMHLWKHSGRSIVDLIQTLIDTAISHHRNSQKTIGFNSSIIEHTIDYLEKNEIS